MMLIEITQAMFDAAVNFCNQYNIVVGDRYKAIPFAQFLMGVANGDHPTKPPKA